MERQRPPMSRLSIILLSTSALMAAVGQILFRLGARDKSSLLALFNVHILTGVALYGGGTLIWIFVLSREKLVDVYAFTALTFALVYVGAVTILDERLQLQAMAGLALVLLGLFLLARAGH